MNYKQDNVITVADKREFLFKLTGDWNSFVLNEEEVNMIFNIIDNKTKREVK